LLMRKRSRGLIAIAIACLQITGNGWSAIGVCSMPADQNRRISISEIGGVGGVLAVVYGSAAESIGQLAGLATGESLPLGKTSQPQAPHNPPRDCIAVGQISGAAGSSNSVLVFSTDLKTGASWLDPIPYRADGGPPGWSPPYIVREKHIQRMRARGALEASSVFVPGAIYAPAIIPRSGICPAGVFLLP
jgi:hypothetical protein